MNVHYADTRKIAPGLRPDNTPDDDDRVEIGPTPLAYREFAAAGLECPDLPAMRRFRLDRLVRHLHDRDYGAILLYDPLNIRYASDTTNMQLWNAHNPFRACFVAADGYMCIWDFKRLGDLLTSFNPLVQDTFRGNASFFYFSNGDGTRENATNFAAEIEDLMRQHCPGNKRLAVDKIMVHGLRALEARGIEVMEGEEVTEKARVVKGPDEIKAMRCAVVACDHAMDEMRKVAVPGAAEDEIWAELHKGNIKRGGEWIETRLMASGQRTNPWFQECGPRIVKEGELLGFDTDLVGVYGMCVDISRTWFIGEGEPTQAQKELHRIAHQHIVENTAMLGPGIPFKDLTFGGHQLPEKYVEQRYGAKMHGVGLCDEWPLIVYPQDWREGLFDYVTEPGMVLCVEVYLGEVGGKEGVKLEDQVLITEDGHELLSRYPFDPKLMG
ncbi:MAG: dimethylsulfonioproprionate lyase DddP [Pseudomonadota bacterium]